ncbi:hypothetical protein GHT06_012340 [Daphnia sinensis]|uniref:Uncharacterized protein n=1 Tax=Daphnia sinensis TaxID=1820382 RepID=A0AAD5LFP8_9CRUS|nr:hypothetical protein GHT06_012340 [Daphnia sinensis]
MSIMRARTIRPNMQERVRNITLTAVIWWMIPASVVCGMLHPALELRYRGQQQPNALDERTASTTLMTIDDATVSFLFKVKLFPFRLKTVLDESSSRGGGGSSLGTAPETGIVAFGIDIGLPGSLGGLGYGHQMPIESLSISSVRIHAKSLSNNGGLKEY